VAEFEGCDLTEFLTQVGRTTGFEVEEHLLQLEGLCLTCRSAGKPTG
jgi:Fe2+ or Zn2+ uptake regulation protein